MQLSQLELFGFKSFADKTVLKFKPGITAIVGPNGCGKSNISDAFRWVLGEQSAKSMRGSKMLDVIFAGTATRKALNFAEVTLTFTGMEQYSPFSEVAVTRRLHRNGESDYFINKKSVRLKDVCDLFLDSGVGKDAFAFFEQGKIDQVINHSPLERRYIFEDAAGILRFLIRKKEALGKLDHVDLNLSRVKDIHSEVEKQIAVLEEQAVKAKEYKEKKAQFELLEQGILHAKWQNFSRLLIEYQTAKQNLSSLALTSELEKELLLLKEAKGALDEMRRHLQEKTQAVHQMEREIALLKQERQTHLKSCAEMEAGEKKWGQNGLEIASQRQKREQEKQQLVREESIVREEAKGWDEKLILQREEVKKLEQEMSETRQQQQAVEKERYQLMQREKQLESEHKQNQVRFEHALEKKNGLAAAKKELNEAMDEIVKRSSEQESIKAALEGDLAECKKLLGEMEKNCTAIVDVLQEKERQLTLKHKKAAEDQARKNILTKLRDEKQGFSQGSKQLLREFNQKIKPLYECVSNDNGAAIAAVMRPYAQTLVVETKEDLQAVFAYARQHGLKDLSLICLEGLAVRENYPGEEGLIPLFSPGQDRLSRHFFTGVFAADSVERAWTHTFRGMWVEEGIYVDANGVLFYQSQAENHPFLREAELKKLEKELKQHEKESLEFEKELTLLKERKQQLFNEKRVLEENGRKKELALVEAQFVLKRLLGEKENKLTQRTKIETEGEGLDRVIADLERKGAELKKQLGEAQERVIQVQGQYEKSGEQIRERQTLWQEKQKRLQECDHRQRETQDKLKKLTHALQVVEIKEQESAREEQRAQEEFKNCAEKKKILSEQEKSLGDRQEKLMQVWQTSEVELKGQKEQVQLSEQKIAAGEQLIETKRSELKAQEEKGYQLGIQIAQTESMVATFDAELKERYPGEVQPLPIPLEKAERKMKQLRQELGSGDQINLTSIEECEKHKVRHAFLQQQVNDLEAAKQELVHIITDLDGTSRKIFKETFEAIRENFRKNYTILFQGGAADLQFTESSDVLEAGIEIVAQPPGKKMQSIQLLSGGEKCLTAMALLFALFEVKPAPFCILDEIDAPLDDSNVARFMRIVKEYADRCQFIIVTHNKETMAEADVLFGVSMEEKGVSRVLTVEFAEELSVS